MNISACNYSHSFGKADENIQRTDTEVMYSNPVYDENGEFLYYDSANESYALQKCDNYLNEINKNQDTKTPLAILGSVGAAIIGTYVMGKRAGNVITAIPVMKKAPEYLEKGLKSSSKKAQKYAQSLTKETPVCNTDKLKNIAGKSISNLEKAARTGYKKIAYFKIPDNVVNPERAKKAFANVTGTAAALSIVPQIITNDHNKDGINDIAQKSQNAYTGTSYKINNSLNNLTILGELVEVLA